MRRVVGHAHQRRRAEQVGVVVEQALAARRRRRFDRVAAPHACARRRVRLARVERLEAAQRIEVEAEVVDGQFLRVVPARRDGARRSAASRPSAARSDRRSAPRTGSSRMKSMPPTVDWRLGLARRSGRRPARGAAAAPGMSGRASVARAVQLHVEAVRAPASARRRTAGRSGAICLPMIRTLSHSPGWRIARASRAARARVPGTGRCCPRRRRSRAASA